VELSLITDAQLFLSETSYLGAAEKVHAELCSGAPADLLCDSCQGLAKLDAAEDTVWAGWPGNRASPKKVLGEGFMAASAWQCVFGVESLRRGVHSVANISVVGCNEQAIGVQFRRCESKGP
jgi:hypothetical protein